MLGALLNTYLSATLATRGQVQSVNVRLEGLRASRRRAARSACERERALENDLGRVALLARALAEVCLRKGLLTEEELGRMILEVDLEDGVSDGKLDPGVVFPGERTLAQLEPLPDPSPAAPNRGRPIVRRKRLG